MRRTRVEGLPPVGTPVWRVDTDTGRPRVVEGVVRRHYVSRSTFETEWPREGWGLRREHAAGDIGRSVYLRREEAELQVAQQAKTSAGYVVRNWRASVSRAEDELAGARQRLETAKVTLAEAAARVAELEAAAEGGGR